MRVRDLLPVLLLCSLNSYAAILPLDFESTPTYPQTINYFSSQTLTYTLKNNTRTTLPLTITVTPAASFTVGSTGNTCQNQIRGLSTCQLPIVFSSTTASSSNVSGVLTIDYKGRFPLKDSNISFNITPVLFGVTGDGSPSQPETLFTMDAATGSATFVMTLGNGGDGEIIASNGLNLYHWSGNNTPRIFERINLDNLTTTLIPFSGYETFEIFGAVYYAGTNSFLTSDILSGFATYTINGVATLLGSSINDIRGMACYNHQIYAVDTNIPTPNVHQINPSNGAFLTSFPITLSGFTVQNSNSITVNPNTGVFYALLKVSGTNVRKLVTINVDTGVATLIGNADNGSGVAQFASIAFQPADATC